MRSTQIQPVIPRSSATRKEMQTLRSYLPGQASHNPGVHAAATVLTRSVQREQPASVTVLRRSSRYSRSAGKGPLHRAAAGTVAGTQAGEGRAPPDGSRTAKEEAHSSHPRLCPRHSTVQDRTREVSSTISCARWVRVCPSVAAIVYRSPRKTAEASCGVNAPHRPPQRRH